MKIRQAELWSSNETIEDLSAKTIKYLLVPYYLGRIRYNTPETEPSKRLDLLKKVVRDFRRFLTSVDSVELLPDGPEKALLSNALISWAPDATIPPKIFSSSSSVAVTGSQRRTDKIERAKRDRVLETAATAAAGGVEKLLKLRGAQGVISSEEADGGIEEETERKVNMLLIRQAVGRALDEVEGAAGEIEMLSIMVDRFKAEGKETVMAQVAADKDPKNAPPPAPGAPTAKAPIILKSSTDAHKLRAKLAGDVFGNKNLPTMSVEEFLDQEAAVLMAQQEQAAMARATEGGPPPGEDADSEDEDVAEAKRLTAMANDDMIESTPKGGGNLHATNSTIW